MKQPQPIPTMNLHLTPAILAELAEEARRHGFAATVRHALKSLDRWTNQRATAGATIEEPVTAEVLKNSKEKLLLT